MIYSRSALVGLASVVTLGLAACSNDAATADQEEMATSADATPYAAVSDPAMDGMNADAAGHAEQFLTDAMKGDNSEVKLGRLAAEKGSDKGVRDFGDMLVKDHGAAKQEVADLARSMNVPVTDETKSEADAEFAKLQGMSGTAFDQEFVAYMIEDHQKDIAKFQQEAQGDDPQAVTGLAAKTVPTLQKHLRTAESLK